MSNPNAQEIEVEPDFDLTLEHQLEQEAPETPMRTTTHLDPVVVDSIISQLRADLEKEKKAREELSGKLAMEADLRHELQDSQEHCATLESELSASKQKSSEDEEAINLLRGKVEESRRGLMRLQTESRRKSLTPMTIDITSTKNKRQSMNFTPLTGSGFALPRTPVPSRSQTMSSDAGIGSYLVSGNEITFVDTPPTPQTPQAFPPPSSSSNRFSGLFGRSPPQTSPALSPVPSRPSLQRRLSAASSASVHDEQLEALRVELETLRKQVATTKEALDETRHELTESNEAREASEACVNALREFIANNGVGEQGRTTIVEDESHQPSREVINLPPLPGMTTGEEEDTQPSRSSGWGFGKMWGRAPSATKEKPSPPPALSRTSSVSSMSEAEPISPATEDSDSHAYILRDDIHIPFDEPAAMKVQSAPVALAA